MVAQVEEPRILLGDSQCDSAPPPMEDLQKQLRELMRKAKQIYSPKEPECPFTPEGTIGLDELMKMMGIK